MVVEMVVLKLVVAEDMIVLVDDTVVLVDKVVEGVWLVADNGDVVCVVDSVLLPVVGVAVLLVSVVDVVAELVSRVVDGVWLGVNDVIVLVVEDVELEVINVDKIMFDVVVSAELYGVEVKIVVTL